MNSTASLALQLPDGQTVDVRLSRNARTRISLNINAQGEVRLSMPPGVAERDALAFLQAQRDWLLRQLQQRPVTPEAADEPLREILYQGECLPLESMPGQRRVARLQGEALQIYGAADEADLRQIAARWLQRQAALTLPAQVTALAAAYGVQPSKVALSSAGRRWGSCTGRGSIRLNWRLVQAPQAVVDYVVAHELAHLRHMNHSLAFWAQVEQWCPEWKLRRAWLRERGAQLFAMG